MFWKSVMYHENKKTIYSAVQKKNENDHDIDVEVKFTVADVRRVLDLRDSNDDPIIVPENLCKGLWFRMGFTGHVNDKYLKSKFCRPHEFMVHCVVHALSHRKGAYDETSEYIMNIITCMVLNMHYNISQVLFEYMIDNIKGKKYIMYPRFIQMLLNDQVPDLLKDLADELKLHHMTCETFSRLNQYKGLKEDSEPRVKRMICNIANPDYVAPENDAWRHENSNSEHETEILSEMNEKRLRYWCLKDGKRKGTPKVSPKVVAPKVVIKGKFERGSHIKASKEEKSPPRLVDEKVIPPADVIKEGVDLMKETLEGFLKKNEEAEAAKAAKVQGSSVEKVVESSVKNVEAERFKEKEVEGVVHTNSKDSTYIPTPEENKKLRKHKARPTGVIPRNVRARKGTTTIPEMQSGKAPEVQQAQSTPKVEVQSVNIPKVQTAEVDKEKAPESPIFEKVEKNVEAGKDDDDDDDDEAVFMGERESTLPPPPENPIIHIDGDVKKAEGPSSPKNDTSSGSYDGFPKIHGEFSTDLLDGDFDRFHDEKIKVLTKKVKSLEKVKLKAEAKHDDLKKKLKKALDVNEEMKLAVNDHAERIDALIEDLSDNAKLID
ncbi:hypothetical protein Hanom_Chr07g00629451 [Helianthus anomalus]